MNNDLISRTALAMRFIDETHSYSSERILQLIRRQPTAFNVEKVVEQLKEAKGTVFIDGKEMYNEDYFIDIDDAIEIVKGGRIDGNG